jgi:glycosyltransferase involved in cell wall biosynthesis
VTTPPLVSVVIPVLNREHCIVECVESVLRQTHPVVECVVVDDGSADRTVALLTASFADDARVRIVTSEHAGPSGARNRGIAHATGEFVTFLDSDDLMVDERVERQLAYIRDTDHDAVMARQRQVLIGDAQRPEWLEGRPDWWDGYFHTSIMADTRRVRAAGGFDETMRLGEDIDFVIRLVTVGARVGVLDDILTVRRFFGDNLSHEVESDEAFRLMLGSVRRHRARLRSSTRVGDDTTGDG